jgi:hypothetical protein
MASYVITYDIDVYRGDDWGPLAFRVSDQAVDGDGEPLWDDPEETVPTVGDPLDLTGCEVKAQIRKDTVLASPVLAEMVTTVLDQGDPETQGMATVELAATDSETLPVAKLRYDVQVTNAAGKIHTYLSGKVTVSGDVTRDE